ncbi:efflux RND transporter periplasmic adaptor subunit [Francisella sp. 19X1-34]|uniref:efflux RND transporter periplasmic adaptor subunit n=1 Tax=Francisella sp. 19X1-34 TaxID=3087177 RepID=UPI002E36662A|nr:efflux RND transporter periplasmic adaptor subunit [Francisella sp. 19X1-34]MED7789488.1 efflux RND transporter periplasmic adaptor subunit [Francisella sp. 19X1-34]
MYLYKKLFKQLNEKINASKKNYIIFAIVLLVLLWLILGDFGVVVGVLYLIFKSQVVKNQLPKLRNRRIAAITAILITLIIFSLIFGIAFLMQTLTKYKMKYFVPEPANVTSSIIKETDWKQTIDAIGEAKAIQATQISSQSGGIISEIDFKSGQEVKKGQILFKLDTSQLKADLEEAVSKLKLAKITAERYDKLVKLKATSKESADKANTDYLSALAQVQNIESQIGFKEVRAPFDGKIGIRNINLGQYFNDGSNAATLTKISPIFVTFAVPQNKVSLIKIGENISFYSDSFPGKVFTAKVTAVNSFINDTNRSIIVQATYKNQSHYIVPGMFLNVHVNLPDKKKSIVIPRNAINYSLYGESILTLTPELTKLGKPRKSSYSNISLSLVKTNKILYKVGEVNIKVLETRNNLALVSGLKPNTMIVTSGQNKIHKGMDVILNNSVKFRNNLYTQGNL